MGRSRRPVPIARCHGPNVGGRARRPARLPREADRLVPNSLGDPSMKPIARRENLLVEEIGGEVVVYDRESDRAHSLNQTAALVWRHADGERSVAELAALVGSEFGAPADVELVRMALE